MNAGQMDAENLAPSPLWQLPTWLLSRLAAQGDRLVSARFATEGVRKHHFTVLLALDVHGPSSQAALGRRLSIDRSDLHALLAELIAAGLVAREQDEQDRRRNVVQLTPAGLGTLRRLEIRTQEAQQALLEPLTADEREQLQRLLTRLVKHHARPDGAG